MAPLTYTPRDTDHPALVTHDTAVAAVNQFVAAITDKAFGRMRPVLALFGASSDTLEARMQHARAQMQADVLRLHVLRTDATELTMGICLAPLNRAHDRSPEYVVVTASLDWSRVQTLLQRTHHDPHGITSLSIRFFAKTQQALHMLLEHPEQQWMSHPEYLAPVAVLDRMLGVPALVGWFLTDLLLTALRGDRAHAHAAGLTDDVLDADARALLPDRWRLATATMDDTLVASVQVPV